MKDLAMPYSRLITITAGSAEVAAVGWAGGLGDHAKSAGVSKGLAGKESRVETE